MHRALLLLLVSSAALAQAPAPGSVPVPTSKAAVREGHAPPPAPAQAPVLQAEPARAHDGALQLTVAGVQVSVSLTREGALRLLALRDGVQSVAPLGALDLGRGPALREGPYSVQAEGAALLVARGARKLFRVAFEPGPDMVLHARVELPEPTTFHGLGHVAKELALPQHRYELRHTPQFGDQTYLYIPFLFTRQGTAFYLNAAGSDVIELRAQHEAIFSTTSGRVELFAYDEPTPSAAVQRFYKFSNSRSLLPRWAYGYLQSRFGYRSDAEVRTTVGAFKKFGLPLRGIVLDLYWFRRMGDLDWNREAFPEPKGLAAWLHEQGVKLVTISEPFFTEDSKQYGAFDAAGILARDAGGKTVTWTDWWAFGGKGGGVLDPFAKAAPELLGARYAALAKDGVDGFWIDLGEPERVPDQTRFGPYSEAQAHDVFNLEWARIVRRGFVESRRPFILSRSGWTGIAGLGVSTWSGDVPARWEALRDQLPLGLEASLSGLPYWGSDVGGFVTGGGELLPPDPELYLRWQQFGAFTPVYRAHGFGPREPWIYGEEVLRRVRAAIVQREFLLPYLYSTAYQVWAEGLPMMRPLFFADPALGADQSAFLLGDSVLVAPVWQPLEKQREKVVHLPKGAWFDAATFERHEGEVRVPLTLERIPVFYREGAIVPVAPAAQRGETDAEGLLLLPGPTPTRFTAFSDDGETEAYRSGAGEKLQITLDTDGVTLEGAQRERDLLLLFPKATPIGALAARTVRETATLRSVRVHLSLGRQHFSFASK